MFLPRGKQCGCLDSHTLNRLHQSKHLNRSFRPQTWLDESGSPDKSEPGRRICNPIEDTRGYKYLVKPHRWPDLIYRPIPHTSILHRTLKSYSFYTSFSILQTQCMRYPSRKRHNGDIGADVQYGPVLRILFRLRPCVNLFYCLLLL